MHRAGLTELEVMALADMRSRAQAYRRHAGGYGRSDAARAVFDDKA